MPPAPLSPLFHPGAPLLLTALLLLPATTRGAPDPSPPPTTGKEIWIGKAELQRLPTSGPAWEALLEASRNPATRPRLSDQEDMTNVWVLAKALVHARTGDPRLRQEVIEACLAAMGTEEGARSLAIGRELGSYVLAADLVGLPPEADARFRPWLQTMLGTDFQGRTIRSTQEDRPNNWGLHAGATRTAIARYLGDQGELERAAKVFKGYLGDRIAYAEFRYGALDWQANPRQPVGINGVGALIRGHDVDGVLPDDQRRCCKGFTWPPPHENYVYEGLQGALATAVMLHRAGYDVWNWGDRALFRAFRWLHTVADFPAKGDDTWQPHVINHYYGTDFPAPVPSRPGKSVGYTDWTHGPEVPYQPR